MPTTDNVRASDNALLTVVQRAVPKAANVAGLHGLIARARVARKSKKTLRHNGVKINATPPGLERELQRIGERFSSEWVKAVGADALEVFIPYFMAARQ